MIKLLIKTIEPYAYILSDNTKSSELVLALEGETKLFTSLGKAHGLNITCGSDFHGSTRPEAVIGGCYDGCDELKLTEEKLYRLFF